MTKFDATARAHRFKNERRRSIHSHVAAGFIGLITLFTPIISDALMFIRNSYRSFIIRLRTYIERISSDFVISDKA